MSDNKVFRKPIPSPQDALFDLEPDWSEHWWGMPEFSIGNVKPRYSIRVHFFTAEDVKRFSEALGVKAFTTTKSLLFSDYEKDIDRPGAWEWADDAEA